MAELTGQYRREDIQRETQRRFGATSAEILRAKERRRQHRIDLLVWITWAALTGYAIAQMGQR